jgi:hypothetical protein
MTMEAAPDRGEKCPADIATLPLKKAWRLGRQARKATLEGVDRRTAAYRVTRRLMADIESDLGGAEQLTAAERELVQRVAVMGAYLTEMEKRWIGGEKLDPAVYCTLVNAQRRVAETIGLRRRPRDVTPSISSYLASREPEAAA